jgi:hypothetical protein
LGKTDQAARIVRWSATGFTTRFVRSKTRHPRPLHDWTSHAADSFRYLALTLDRRATHSGFYRRIDYPQHGVV